MLVLGLLGLYLGRTSLLSILEEGVSVIPKSSSWNELDGVHVCSKVLSDTISYMLCSFKSRFLTQPGR